MVRKLQIKRQTDKHIYTQGERGMPAEKGILRERGEIERERERSRDREREGGCRGRKPRSFIKILSLRRSCCYSVSGDKSLNFH